MPAIDLDTARTVAGVATVVFVVLAVICAVVLKSMAQKLALLAIFGLLAVLVWSQRGSLDNCVDVVQAATTTVDGSITCTFFGQQVGLTQDLAPG